MIFIFFVEGGRGWGGVLGVLIGGSEPEWEMRRTEWGDRQGALCTGFTLVYINPSLFLVYANSFHLKLNFVNTS